jgi:hypothetical protein
MATVCNYSFLVAMANGTIDLATADLRLVLLKSTYVNDPANDWLSDIDVSHRVGSPVAIDPQTVAAHAEGVSLNFGNTTVTGLDGTTVNACQVFVYNAAEGAAQLVAYHQLAVPSGGSEVVVRWPGAPDYVMVFKAKPKFAITGVEATDVITTDVAHGLSPGAAVAISGLTGGAGLADGNYLVETTPLSTTLTLRDYLGAAVNFTTNITAGTLAVLS